MTQLIVKPIQLDKPGSYRERKRLIGLLKQLRDLSKTRSADIFDILEEADRLIRDRLFTDDGTTVDDALDQLSALEFDALLSAIAFESGVGEASAAPSPDGPVGAALLTTTP